MTTSANILRGLMTAIDEHRWDDIEPFLHADFACRLVHTGEVFSREEWIRFNAGYPGFDRLVIEELVAEGDAAACRSHVTGRVDGDMRHFECASFAHVQEGRILKLTEVWTNVEQQAPAGTRLGAVG